jgi:ATP-dependent helicase/nuclease subunit B
MSTQLRTRSERVEAWLKRGGLVLASTERAARAVAAAYHAARREEGRTAWATPAIFAWDAWVKEQWLERNRAGLMLLNSLQEQAVWELAIRNRPAVEGVLDTGRLAASAMQAYRLLWSYAPESLGASARLGWVGDAAIFSEWLTGFEERCRREVVISASRIGFELTGALLHDTERSRVDRAPILLVGFDRLPASQEALLNAWGVWQTDESELIEAAAPGSFFAARDAAEEIEACAQWLRRKLAADPDARLMVVTPGLRERRGELERALLDVSSVNGADALQFEFSLGVPLAQVGVVRGALLLMRWMIQPLSEAEMDWLLCSGYCAASADEEIALARTMLALRSRGMERPEWTLEAFCAPESALPLAWAARLAAGRRLLDEAPRQLNPLEWVRFTGELLETAGWPGFRPASSVVFQARERWGQMLEECGSLGFDGGGMDWAEFVRTVGGAVSDAIFATESTDAAVQITEPVASAGLVADGIWFLGAHEANWPGRGQPHPLLPIGLQRETGMPHASPQADWTLAQETTRRLLASADEVVFSYARQAGEVETRPSRLVIQQIGVAQELPEETLAARSAEDMEPVCETFEDWGRIPFPLPAIAGGAGTLTSQSLCPFQAFATARLGAVKWEPAEAGLNAKQRGQLLHAVLHRIWGGTARGGIASLAELEAISDLARFVRGVVDGVLHENTALRRFLIRFPQRLVELEAERLTKLVAEWLAYERQRLPFAVAATEDRTEVTIAGLTLRLQLDRVDVLADGSKLVIDYKSGDVGPSAWRGARPDDVQLPLYAAFAVGEGLEGLVFGRVRPGEMKFCGRVRDANGLLMTGLHSGNGLVKDPLTEEQLGDWRRLIERLGADFLAGRADVNPKDSVKTCEACHLHAVCRINENQTVDVLVAGDEGEGFGEMDGAGGRDD